MFRSVKGITRPESGVSEEFIELNFQPSEYKDSAGRKLSEYLLTKDGFTILAMGFTGKEANRFKEAYINKFNTKSQNRRLLNNEVSVKN